MTTHHQKHSYLFLGAGTLKRLAMDTIGPLTKTESGRQYLNVLRDRCMKHRRVILGTKVTKMSAMTGKVDTVSSARVYRRTCCMVADHNSPRTSSQLWPCVWEIITWRPPSILSRPPCKYRGSTTQLLHASDPTLQTIRPAGTSVSRRWHTLTTGRCSYPQAQHSSSV